jgi:2',3'-cyclic-nucleotide 2'-phosphodiesterase (5'-nucleotidase family)
MTRTRRVLALACLLCAFWLSAQSRTEIVVMHTNDLHGQLLPRNGEGGIAELGTVIQNNHPDLMLDAGDRFTGTLLNDEFEGEPMIQALNLIGYHAAAVGNHEFDYGLGPLRERTRQANFPFLTANLDTGIPEIRKFVIIPVKGIRFGVIGLTLEDLLGSAHPDKVRTVNVKDVVRSLAETLPEVRRLSDFVILVTHLNESEEKRVAAAFPEVRLIIGGHDHSVIGPVWLGNTLVAKTGSSGRNVGRVDLEFEGTGLKSMVPRVIPVKDVAPDPDIKAALLPFEAKVADKMSLVVGEATDDMVKSDISESALANHIVDAFRATGKTDVAFHNIGGIRAGLSRGPITWGRVFEVLPFQNFLFKLKLTGTQIKRVLDHNFIAVSGLRVRFDLRKPVGRRLVQVTMADGSPLEDERLYSVTTNDFVVAGGDGFLEFAEGRDIENTGIVLRDVFIEYIRSHTVITAERDGRVF